MLNIRTNTSDFDNELSANLKQTKATISAQIDSLYRRHPICRCNETGLCAHHATIAINLRNAIKAIDVAIQCANYEVPF